MKNKIGLIFFVSLIWLSCSTPTSNEVELVIDSKSELGEGAIWNYRTGDLMWVNIKGKILNFYNPETGFNKEMLTGQMVGTVVPTESGKVLVALQNGIYSLDPETGSKTLLADPEADKPDNRFNDGKCDPAGRLWAGTMSLVGAKQAGALYRFDPDTSVHKMVDGVGTSNGIVWSADKTRMYYIDTPTRKVMGYDYDNETGDISNPKVAVEIPDGAGYPDGMTIDADGNLWVALWGGSAVGCFNPETGELIRKIEVPAKNVTSCAFGGNDLGTLYITTARESTSEEELQQFPHAGGVFSIRPGVKGVKAFFFNDLQ
ncbi:SMP-30/gluconolactonase/LRE family protein [Maribellus sp. YY47]|uniref:SMP-30/gluconolactonase/LRE family protein n=1 Tax=Maribellus sp. YY47 TaxID=2929486 RepID=UPI0020011E38|nr:SMP-30/gluconolactonase/LRE family protein [Maribellus sp. YY47]MCK3685847.1 SMP-30/gluconolactonase/LRE family protein [Maribellus sp. YY47]